MAGRTCRREVLPDGILYASRDSHYSVFKAARMYRMEAVKVDTLLSGEIDCADLKRKLTERKDKPAILNVNIGECQYRCSCVYDQICILDRFPAMNAFESWKTSSNL